MPINVYGGGWHNLIQPLIYHNFKFQELSPRVGGGYFAGLKKFDGTAAKTRVANKKATVLNGTTQYWSKSSPVNLDMNGVELLSNTGFETVTGTVDDGITDDIVGWSKLTNGGVVDSTATVHGGSKAVKIIRNTTGNLFIYRNSTVTPGMKLTLEFWARGDGINAGIYYVHDVTNDVYVVLHTTTGISSTSYGKVVVNFVVPATCVTIQVYLMSSNINPSTVYFDDVSLTQAYDFTILARVKSSSATAQRTVNRQGGGDFTLSLSSGGKGNLFILASGETNVNIIGGTTINDGNEHLLACSIDRDGNAVLVVDGVADGSASCVAKGKMFHNGILSVGRYWSSALEFFNGQIGELQIIRGYALSVQEVQYVYDYGIPDSWPVGEVVAHYKWDDSDGTDETGNNTLTATGSPTFGTGTYTQYSTFQNDGVRLWGNYLSYDIPGAKGSVTGAVLTSWKPLGSWAQGWEHTLFEMGVSAPNRVRFGYSSSNDKLNYEISGSNILGTSITIDSQLQTQDDSILSWNFSKNNFERFVAGTVKFGSYGTFGQITFGSVFHVGNAIGTKYSAPIEVYKFALFNTPIEIHQAINFNKGYKYAH